MSKSILVIDTPKGCLECEFCGYLADFKDGFRSCFLNEHTFEERDAEEEYLMCPLRPLPKMKDADILAEFTVSRIFNTGWNACIKAIITGETK